MIALNPAGIAACLTPGARGSNGTYTCDVYLMFGELPTPDTLEPIDSTLALNTLFPEYAFKFSGLSIQTTYDYGINERIFKKTPVDALPFTPLFNGSIGWVAIVFPGDKIIFTDSVSTWDDEEACVTLTSLTSDTAVENILKDINLIIRDKSTYELFPNGIFA